jgi:hypothetical protein
MRPLGVFFMIKRSLAVLAVAGIALAVPATAMATTEYPAPEPTLTCSTTQAQPGTDFECIVTGDEGADAQLQTTFSGADAEIAGTATSAVKTITGGEASFTVTAPTIEGTIGITAIVDGVPLSTSASVDVSEELSSTGFDSMPLAIGAGALLVAGAAVVFVAARRRSSQNV